MELLLKYPDGQRTNAILLAASSGTMRVAVQDQPDTTELRLVKGLLYDEEGRAIEIDAITTDGETDVSSLCAQLLSRSFLAVG